MNSLIRSLSGLSIQKQSHRYLVGFADTEGTPHRKKNANALWEYNITFDRVVNDQYEIIETVYHTNHMIWTKNAPDIKKKLTIFHQVNQDIMDQHDCSKLIVCFWNAPHDRAVLKHYGVTVPETIDLLALARAQHRGKRSYALQALCRQYNTRTKPTHNAYTDTKAMIELVQAMPITLRARG